MTRMNLEELEKEINELKKSLRELYDDTQIKEKIKEKDRLNKVIEEAVTLARKSYAEQIVANEKFVNEIDAVDQTMIENKKATLDKLIELQDSLAGSSSGKANDIANKKVLGKTSADWKKFNESISETAKLSAKAIGDVFSSTTKMIDQDIANSKKRLEQINKELAKPKIDHDLVLSQAREAAITGTEGDSTEKSKTATEIAELERLYNLQLEMDEVNKERKKNAQEGIVEELRLSEEQQASFDGLSEKHQSYAQALTDKTQNEQDEQSRHAQLLTEKEKTEAEIAKKEKQKKRMEVANQITQATVNIAEGVTKALASPFPMNIINAAIVGAAGAVQLGVMIANAAKIKYEDGGLLSGPRHAQGGLPIMGSNIEVEGGEYVVNRQSTRKNLGAPSL